MRCPLCEKGNLRKKKIKENMFGVYLGEYPADVCSNCSESFTDSETTKRIEESAKKAGIWGLGFTTRIARAGNSLAVRVPKRIAEYLRLKEGRSVFVHPEKDRLVVEINS